MIPMLACGSSRPSTTIGLSSSPRMRRANLAAPSVPSGSVWTIANSSPPSRATRSVLRVQVIRRSATAFEERIARVMPEGVVDDLELVEVEEVEGQHATPVPGLFQAAGQEILEDDSVGQAGQGIVMRAGTRSSAPTPCEP